MYIVARTLVLSDIWVVRNPDDINRDHLVGPYSWLLNKLYGQSAYVYNVHCAPSWNVRSVSVTPMRLRRRFYRGLNCQQLYGAMIVLLVNGSQ